MTASPCDTCGKGMENMRLLKKLTETEIENDELRCQTEILDIAFDVKRNDLRKLSDENARLRELCTDMWRFTGAACKKYPRLFDPAAQGQQTVQLNALDYFEQRIRELGIEVG